MAWWRGCVALVRPKGCRSRTEEPITLTVVEAHLSAERVHVQEVHAAVPQYGWTCERVDQCIALCPSLVTECTLVARAHASRKAALGTPIRRHQTHYGLGTVRDRRTTGDNSNPAATVDALPCAWPRPGTGGAITPRMDSDGRATTRKAL